MINLLPKYLENRFVFKQNDLGSLGVNTELNVTVPAGKIWIPLAFYSNFACDATVISRVMRLYFTDGTNRIAGVSAPSNLTAATTWAISLANNLTQTGQVGSSVNAGLPLLPLPEGYKIITSTQSLQAGDQFTAVSLSYLEADVTEPA